MPKRNKKIFEPLHAARSIAMNYIVNGRRPENLFHFLSRFLQFRENQETNIKLRISYVNLRKNADLNIKETLIIIF